LGTLFLRLRRRRGQRMRRREASRILSRRVLIAGGRDDMAREMRRRD